MYQQSQQYQQDASSSIAPPVMVVGALLGIEGLHALDGDFANVRRFFDEGVRMMALTHFFDNDLGGSAAGVDKGGITRLGARVIREMELLGILVDVAHASEPTIDDILRLARRPVVNSHTGVRAVCPSQRNLSDKHIRGIAQTGGIIAITYFRPAICGTKEDPADDIGSIVESVRYVISLVGAQHVALGSDFDGAVSTSIDTAGLAQITDRMLREGFTEEEIRLVAGDNVARVLQEILPEE